MSASIKYREKHRRKTSSMANIMLKKANFNGKFFFLSDFLLILRAFSAEFGN